MPITLKKDVWKVKDPSSGQYRGAAILSTTLPQDAAQIISESNDTIQNIKDTAIEAVDTALNDESTGLIPKAEADRDAINDSLNNVTDGIIPTAQSDRDDIDDSLNNIEDGIIPTAQANLATIAQAVQSQIGQGTDKTLSVAKGFADAKAAGMLVRVSDYQPGSALDDPATSQDASQNTGYPVYKDSNRVWVKETYAELEVPTMDDHNELIGAIEYVGGINALNDDPNADTSKIYIVNVPGHIYHRQLMIYDTSEETWVYGGKLDTIVEISKSSVKENRFQTLVKNVYSISLITGGIINLVSRRSAQMYNSSGTLIRESSGLYFYEIDDLDNVKTINFVFTGAAFHTHYLNQFDDSGNLLSYATVNDGSVSGKLTVNLLENCSSIKLSVFTDTESWTAYYEDSNIRTEMENQYAELDDKFWQLIQAYGGTFDLRLSSTDSMYNSSSQEKAPTTDMKFYLAYIYPNTNSLIFSHTENGSANTHWYNEYNSNDELIFTQTQYSKNKQFVVTPSSECAYIKVSSWVSDGTLSIKDVVRGSEEIIKDSGFTKLSALGDSITAGYSPEGTVTDTYQKLIADRLGISFQNLGISSTPICPNSNYDGGQNSNAFVYRYTHIANDADLICVSGGTNDFRHKVPLGNETDTDAKYEQTFYGAVDYLIKNIKITHPLARLVMISPFHQINDENASTTLDDETVYLSDYIEAIKKKCRKYGVLFIDAYAESGVNMSNDFVTNYMTDSLHPNAQGHRLIFKNLMHYFATL